MREWDVARAYRAAGLRAPLSTVVPRATLGSILEAYVREIESLGRSGAHVRTVRRVKKLILKGMGEAHPVPLSRQDLVDFAGWARANTKTQGDAIRKAFVYLRTAHRRAELPVPEAPEIRVKRVGRRALDTTATVALLSALPVGTVARAFAETMLRTACREAEALRLCVEDVDFERGLVRFESRKGERSERVKAQDVPMDDGLRAQLVAYGRVGRGGEPYFIVRGGRFMTHTSLRRALERASRAAGISPAITGLGWLKNKAVTMLGEVGVRAEVTARIANHASVKTTERHYDSAVLWEQRKAGLAALGVALDRFCTAPPNSTGFSTGQDSKAPETSQSSLAKSET